ncbi:hypothetical protein MTYP_01275 [Methylophilaceae bacterium]|nr:hypothetical protein MTYP_01275 [Methylophilaceae bacterium]
MSDKYKEYSREDGDRFMTIRQGKNHLDQVFRIDFLVNG